MAWNSCFYIGLRTFGIIMCSELLLLSWALNFCFYLGLGSFAITWLRTLTIILSLKLLQFAKTRTRYHLFQAQANTPLTPDQPQVKRPPPSLQITSNFLVFYGLSHGTTFEKNGVAQILIYSKN